MLFYNLLLGYCTRTFCALGDNIDFDTKNSSVQNVRHVILSR